eukprot:jgi/Astpho2/6176/Aster-03590
MQPGLTIHFWLASVRFTSSSRFLYDGIGIESDTEKLSSVSNSQEAVDSLPPARRRAISVTPGKASRRSCRKVCRTSASYNNNSGGVDIADRVVAALPFCIPLFDGLRYGKFFMLQFPIMAKILAPLDPVIRLYFGFPFASLIIFFAAYLGIVNNQNFSRYVRFAVLQAVLLDIVLILPSLIENLIRPPSSGPGLQLYISAYNTVWLFVFLCVSYGAVSAIGCCFILLDTAPDSKANTEVRLPSQVTCLLGKTPRLPFIADAAEQQLR